jgi:hypothetical protein
MSRNDYTTLARVKVHLEYGGRAPLDSDTWDAYIERLIDDYSAMFDSYLGRGSVRESRTEYFDVAPGQHAFSLAGYPGVTVSTVINDTERAWTGSTISVSDFTVDEDTGILMIDRTYHLLPGWRVLRVAYTGGLATTTTTLIRDYPDLAAACDLQVVHHRARAETLGASAQTMDGQSRTWTGPLDLLPTVRATLDRYRRVTVG